MRRWGAEREGEREEKVGESGEEKRKGRRG